MNVKAARHASELADLCAPSLLAEEAFSQARHVHFHTPGHLMKPRITLRQALDDPALLVEVLGGDTWQAWRSILLAAMGEPLTAEETKTFKQFTGRTTAPDQRVDELWCCIGRRATARDVMTKGIHCCGEEDDLTKAARHMEELKVRRLPVINNKKRMTGILTKGT